MRIDKLYALAAPLAPGEPLGLTEREIALVAYRSGVNADSSLAAARRGDLFLLGDRRVVVIPEDWSK